MRVTICGRLRIESAGAVLDESALPGRLGRRLWTYLVLNRRRPVGRGEIAVALWGDDGPEAADASLNALISRLRAALVRLDPGVELRAATGSYTLALPADVFVDRERAWDAIHHVQAIRRRGDAAGAWAEAVIAHEIAARGFLPGESGEWIEGERRTLADIEMQALEAVVEAELDEGRPAEAERAARALIARDALREAGYRLLMRALAAGGNGAQAAHVIQECRAALEHAGVAVSADTERVFREVSGAGSPRAPSTSRRSTEPRK
ncbi:MAG TPA: BTAD domain-containing putative transcriptional regulator [Candidatus Limnocylindria bacterium]|nr:BTAD domain-containing putative transcriptional regulator [Candidatus Limnocylindria bacterium]